MNKGILMSTGDVVGLLNSDDYFTTNDVIEKLASVFGDRDTDAVYGDIHFIRGCAPDKCIRYYSSARFSKKWLRFGFMRPIRRSMLGKASSTRQDYI